MGVLTMMDVGREASAEFVAARDHMIAVYDDAGVESQEFDAAYEAYVAALETHQSIMDELEHIRAEIAAM